MTPLEKQERRRARQIMIFNAAVRIREHLGGSEGDLKELTHVCHVASLGAVADARALFMCLRTKGIISEKEQEFFLDQGYKALLDQIEGHMKNHGTVAVAGDSNG